jgi:inosine/xanthosine triphosphate pyrophosphatase family protein
MEPITPRRSAGKINALRRWNPDHPDVIAYDIEQVIAAARRATAARALTTDDAAVILDALGLDPGVVCRRPI